MRSNAHFSGLLKPLPSEAFSAWLGRGVRTQNPEPFRRALGCLKAQGVKDADGHLPQTVVEELSRLLGLSGESLRQSFLLPGDWLKAPAEVRLQFCEHCLLNDFCSGRQPTPRVNWFYWWFTVCPVHASVLLEEDSTSAPAALLASVRFELSLGIFSKWAPLQSSWHFAYGRLLYMALFFQCWYQTFVQRGTCIIGNVELAASVAEVELVMGDILAIIGKKRSYPFDQRSLVAELLDIRSWCSLRSDLPPEAGCEPFLCLDVGEHPVCTRMAMFALLGLLLKLPRCVHMWRLGRGWVIDGDVERQWQRMLNDAVRVPSYQAWFRQRSDCWSAPTRAHFRYLLED
ncbi:TniQ family protein [Pseudomonas fluorescens]|uniref:TniQ family protein n=1 Tax=Pseudomonas fluorescens TaxID=294 RepID=UPI003F96A446